MVKAVLLGPPGAGKGTQGKIVSEVLGIPRLVMSDMLREEASRGTELGSMIKRLMDEGRLVPDDVVFRVIEERLKENLDRGFILDGFPRNVKQALWLDDFLSKMETELNVVVSFEVTELTVLRRMMGRLVCSRCGRSYNVFFNGPPDPRYCECGGRLYQRPDDCYEKIIRRLDVFNQETRPLIEFYEKKGILRRIDAERDVEDVTEQLIAVLREFIS